MNNLNYGDLTEWNDREDNPPTKSGIYKVKVLVGSISQSIDEGKGIYTIYPSGYGKFSSDGDWRYWRTG